MPRSYWLSLCAIIGLALAAPTLAQGVGNSPGGNSVAQQPAAKPQPNVQPRPPVAIQNAVKRATAPPKRPEGKPAPTDDQRRLYRYYKSQLRIARWAKWMFLVGALEILITAAGVSLVFFTLRAAQTSAREAKRAADEAKRQADIAERSISELETPFVYPIIGENQLIQSTKRFVMYDKSKVDPVTPEIEFKLQNYGRTPALLQSLSAVMFAGGPEDMHNDPLGGPIPELLLDADTRSETRFRRRITPALTQEAFEAVSADTAAIYLRGTVTFFDIFGNQFEQKFCLKWNRRTDSWMGWGAQRNRRRRVVNNN